MTPTTRLLNESFAPTEISRHETHVATGSQCFSTEPTKVLQFVSPVRDESPIPSGYLTIEEVTSKLERNPRMKEEMNEARRWAAGVLYAGKPVTLRVLRMRRGLSQAQLAEAIGTQQPHIARIENGIADLRLDTCRRLAGALEIDLNTLDQALQSQQPA